MKTVFEMEGDPETMSYHEIAKLPRDDRGCVLVFEGLTGAGVTIQTVWNEVEGYACVIKYDDKDKEWVESQLRDALPNVPWRKRVPN